MWKGARGWGHRGWPGIVMLQGTEALSAAHTQIHRTIRGSMEPPVCKPYG
eukprot:CAMPEP_0174346656 /NCGR_PEP_ID=MMETSP0811_2-20130205/2436_1 /TAXON_ID=73025 ORGANISM="Eutreptiella gymnastica-like, Strain CCMP1594" /NCGR_SAMPLE_ID=MMETSP0811_2 /ASSEMBLY_ACC=CAM_ASM_000667 /LENGTH=49 /DNA_ID=CAMNT_0015471435 /DNA_START=807 /DNA_END=956 /DNA_ORIENTATION=+